MKIVTTESFIERATKIHNNKYDYSNVNYKNNKTKLEIICPIHGNFYQISHSHLAGKGCYKCGGREKLTIEKFIEKAIIIHGKKYDYSQTKYFNAKTRIKIICKNHGSFYQVAAHHLRGDGCPNCGGSKLLTTKEFIKKATKIHGNLYDYSKVFYFNAKTKVEIICPKHGSFKQIPGNHLFGKGCAICSHQVSKPEIQWLDKQRILKRYRQYKIRINNKRGYKVDGYDPITNTIYEFFGDYFHGNPKRFKPDDINTKVKKTFGELYHETINRIELFKTHGYNVKYIWESDFKL